MLLKPSEAGQGKAVRDQAAIDRDEHAEGRDRAAATRDRGADDRDVQADGRERSAIVAEAAEASDAVAADDRAEAGSRRPSRLVMAMVAGACGGVRAKLDCAVWIGAGDAVSRDSVSVATPSVTVSVFMAVLSGKVERKRKRSHALRLRKGSGTRRVLPAPAPSGEPASTR